MKINEVCGSIYWFMSSFTILCRQMCISIDLTFLIEAKRKRAIIVVGAHRMTSLLNEWCYDADWWCRRQDIFDVCTNRELARDLGFTLHFEFSFFFLNKWDEDHAIGSEFSAQSVHYNFPSKLRSLLIWFSYYHREYYRNCTEKTATLLARHH